MYIFSMVSLLVLRKTEPDLKRPFQAPLYPLAPMTALVLASVALLAMIIYNPMLALIFFAILLGSFVLSEIITKIKQ